MARLDASQQASGSQNARLPVQNEAADAAESQADSLFLNEPLGADRSVHRIFPDQIIGAQFPSTAASTFLNGADLVLAFANGGSIVLSGFLTALQAPHPAQLIFEDGTIYELPAHAARAAQAQMDEGLSVASGPGEQAPEIDPGVTAQDFFGRNQGYGQDFGAIGDGLQAIGALSSPGFAPAGQAAGIDASRRPPQPASDAIFSVPGPSQDQAQAEAETLLQARAAVSNSPPSGIVLTGNSVDELLANVPVGLALASDPDLGDSITYTLSGDAGGRFTINAVTGLVSTARALDFETAASHIITVRATDTGGAAVEASFTIAVNDINEIIGGAGADTLTGTPQTDVIDGQDGDDTIFGEGGNDIILGGIGRDTLDGGDGNDSLFGEAQNDILIGGPGADRLFGGGGNDALFIDASDTLIDGGAGTDRVTVQGAAGVTLNMTDSSIELAFGGAGDDVFDATGSNTSIRQDGAGGNDSLTGGNGGDRLRGEGGNDTLSGGAGGDTLEGGAQDDTLTGGAGSDVFIFNLTFAGGLFSAEGNDTITDLTTGDILSFRGVADANGDTAIDLSDLIGHVAVASAGGTTTLSFDGGGSIDLAGIAGPFGALADLTAAGFTLEGVA